MLDNKNLILAVALSVAILFGFQFVSHTFFPKPVPPVPTAQTQTQTQTQTPAVPGPVTPTVPSATPGGCRRLHPWTPGTASGGVAAPSVGQSRAELLAAVPRVRIDTPKLHGSIALVGGRIDDVTLVDYRETLDPNSPEIVLFSPLGTSDAYFAEAGWVSPSGDVAVPGPTTRWTADGNSLTPSTPVTLSWNNGDGLVFKRTFAVDENYMFTVRQSVDSARAEPVELLPYSLISRYGTPPTSGFFILFEGPLGVFDGSLDEVKYKDLQEKGVITQHSTGGWIGITDKYWLSALIPDQQTPINARFIYQRTHDTNQYQVDFVGPQQTVAPGGSIASREPPVRRRQGGDA